VDGTPGSAYRWRCVVSKKTDEIEIVAYLDESNILEPRFLDAHSKWKQSHYGRGGEYTIPLIRYDDHVKAIAKARSKK
jgi:hypothetical protein